MSALIALRWAAAASARINIFQILMHAGMVNGAASAAAQRELADVLLKPPLANVDLLNWRAFDRAIQAGYDYARAALDTLPDLPHLPRGRSCTAQFPGGGTRRRRLAATIAASC